MYLHVYTFHYFFGSYGIRHYETVTQQHATKTKPAFDFKTTLNIFFGYRLID